MQVLISIPSSHRLLSKVSVIKQIFNTLYVPGSLIGIGNKMVSKTDVHFPLTKHRLHGRDGHQSDVKLQLPQMTETQACQKD